ncbi:hypothetical protein PGTUg99_025507 [Puccinia graminis f. sp. tritici]|uniref:Uncharacterized protein n=1 Tax=Puccinia graminis f. sp. tritici TaxID=56615 RepID=A0A5B0NHL1_PUCGR|nr:hypothetical protein PGTUg99_025507 [Puccinia graminis f. sp. tritici]
MSCSNLDNFINLDQTTNNNQTKATDYKEPAAERENKKKTKYSIKHSQCPSAAC